MDTRFLLKEYAKSGVRGALRRFDLGLVRGPFDGQVVRMAQTLGLTAVLDVGANIGQYGAALISGGFEGTITSCEPLADAYAQLAGRAAKRSKWTAVNTAVGAETGSITINVSANSYSSSILDVNGTHLAADATSRRIGTQTVPLTTVAALVAERGIDPARTLLKIDTQGYEASVLDGAAEVLASFAAVQLEVSFVPLYDGQALFPELRDRMEAAGFELWTMAPALSDDATGRLLQADVLYVGAGHLADGR